MVYVNVTINGQIDSRELYEDVRHYKVNVTDFITFTAVYGQVSVKDSATVIDICRKYGDIKSEVTSV